jgi:hypothetical protein
MLSELRLNSNTGIDCSAQIPMPKLDDRWSRDMQEDMKAAVDLLFKFKAGLDKLHPECLRFMDNILRQPNPRY